MKVNQWINLILIENNKDKGLILTDSNLPFYSKSLSLPIQTIRQIFKTFIIEEHRAKFII